MATNKEEALEIVGDYKYGFTTETTPVLTSGKGLNREVVEFMMPLFLLKTQAGGQTYLVLIFKNIHII